VWWSLILTNGTLCVIASSVLGFAQLAFRLDLSYYISNVPESTMVGVPDVANGDRTGSAPLPAP